MIIDKFGIPAIRNSWCDANKIDDHVLRGYTKASKNLYTSFVFLHVTFFAMKTPKQMLLLRPTSNLSAFGIHAAIEGQGLGQGPFRVHISHAYRFCIRASTCKQTH